MPARRWTREKIIQEIQDLHGAGEPLTTRNMRQLGYGGMVAAAYRLPNLGSWPAAVEAAGLDYEEAARRRKWTRQRIIATDHTTSPATERSVLHGRQTKSALLAGSSTPT